MKNPDIYRAELTRGLYTRVAKKLRLSVNGRSHVSRVASGQRRSSRVERALALELQRIERLVAQRKGQVSQQVGLERAA